MTKRKIISRLSIVIIIVCVLTLGIIIVVNATKNEEHHSFTITDTIDPSTNFFTNKENEEKVEEILEPAAPTNFTEVAQNANLILYVNKKNMAIAVYDKLAKYMWYSSYPDISSVATTSEAQKGLVSGVIVEFYDSTNANLSTVTKYSSETKDCEMTFDFNEVGFTCHLNYKTSGIRFDVKVAIDGNKLNAYADLNTLVEEKYQSIARKTPFEYKLASIALFPYFGSANYSINGYSFIPDGSGALIRFTDKTYDTAYIKRIYGNDEGITPSVQADYLKNLNNITLPIYGINHGYNQAAFLAEVTSGYGSAELNAYPYMYSNIALNRTFFRFIARETFNIKMATSTTGSIRVINSNVYEKEYNVKYTFLNNDSANYNGMAKAYKENFAFKYTSKATLKLDTLAQDYKPGLLGKSYIELTKYEDLQAIVKDLLQENINDLTINYIGYNKNGYVDNSLVKIKTDSSLGSKAKFKSLVDYLKANNIELSLYNNPMIAKDSALNKKTVKTESLDILKYYYKTSLDVEAKYVLPEKIDEYFLKNEAFIEKYGLDNFTLASLGATSFSYRYKGDFTPREEMIKQIVEEVKSLNNHVNISLEVPNAYLFNYIKSYYNANYESSKYSFITDSIPFISLILSGHVNMYSNNINYVSNYDLFVLRLIEYNIYPSFMITNEDTNLLRYANFEYLYTTKFTDWKERIIDSYQHIIGILKNVEGKEMVSHRAIDDGIIEIKYSNNYKIYINYTSEDYIYNSVTIPYYGYLGGVE